MSRVIVFQVLVMFLITVLSVSKTFAAPINVVTCEEVKKAWPSVKYEFGVLKGEPSDDCRDLDDEWSKLTEAVIILKRYFPEEYRSLVSRVDITVYIDFEDYEGSISAIKDIFPYSKEQMEDAKEDGADAFALRHIDNALTDKNIFGFFKGAFSYGFHESNVGTLVHELTHFDLDEEVHVACLAGPGSETQSKSCDPELTGEPGGGAYNAQFVFLTKMLALGLYTGNYQLFNVRSIYRKLPLIYQHHFNARSSKMVSIWEPFFNLGGNSTPRLREAFPQKLLEEAAQRVRATSPERPTYASRPSKRILSVLPEPPKLTRPPNRSGPNRGVTREAFAKEEKKWERDLEFWKSKNRNLK